MHQEDTAIKTVFPNKEAVKSTLCLQASTLLLVRDVRITKQWGCIGTLTTIHQGDLI